MRTLEMRRTKRGPAGSAKVGMWLVNARSTVNGASVSGRRGSPTWPTPTGRPWRTGSASTPSPPATASGPAGKRRRWDGGLRKSALGRRAQGAAQEGERGQVSQACWAGRGARAPLEGADQSLPVREDILGSTTGQGPQSTLERRTRAEPSPAASALPARAEIGPDVAGEAWANTQSLHPRHR